MRSHFRYPLLAFALALTAATLPRPVAQDAESEEHARGFDQPDEAMRWILMAQRDEFGNIDPNGLLRAKSQTDAMRARQARAWAALGPGVAPPSLGGINNNSWTWIGPGNIGGRTRAIAINPSNPSNIFIGSVGGGIWRTDNSGASWQVVDDFMANLAVSTIQFRPGDPSTLLAGTGEGFFNIDMIRGLGVFRSTNGGSNWTQLPSTNNSDFHYVNRLAFSPDGSTVLAATRAGIFRSTDTGNAWDRRLPPAGNGLTDVKFLPGSNTNVVASGFNRNAFYSIDGGVTWTAALTGLTGGAGGRVELGVSVSSPNVVYASHAAGGFSSSPPSEVWKSTDSGVNYVITPASGHLSAQGWYDNAVWVDPTNVNHVVAAGVSRYRSTDGFATAPSGMGGSVHSDHHAIVSHPNFDGVGNRQVYYANDGGIYRLQDSEGTSFTRLNNNYGVTQFYGGTGNAVTGTIVGGTQDNGTLRYTPANGPQNWTSMHGSDGGFSAADQTDSNYFYGETQWLGVHRSSNGGTSSIRIDGCGKALPYVLEDGCNLATNFISPILLDPNQPNRLLAGARRLWRTDDARTATTGSTGPTWAVIKAANGASSNISWIAVAPGNSDLIWVGHNNGDLFKTTSGTSPTPIWGQMDSGSVPNRTLTSIAITPSNHNLVYASFGGFSSGNLWKTIDGGTTWLSASGSGVDQLPSVPVRSVVVHPTNPDWIYVGTDVGVFASENAGTTWQVPHDGPANVAVFNLFWMNTTLVAVTHGRGMFTALVSPTLPPVITQNPAPRSIVAGWSTSFTAAATGAPTITWSWQTWNGSVWATVVDGAPYSGATTPTLSITSAPVGLSGLQYRAVATNGGGSTATAAALLTVTAYTAGTNLLQNGDFSGGLTNWQVFEVPDIVWNIVGGVMQFFRASPTTTPSGQAVVYQHSGVALGAGTPLAASFDLGNSSATRKRLTVVILDSNFSDLHVCTFYLAPGAPMRTYQMKTHSNNAWANAAIYFYAASGGSNGGNYLIDSVSLRYDPASSTTRTDCVDPTAPLPPGGAAGPNLLTNGDFTTGLAPWGTFGAITWQITGGVFEYYKPASPPGTPAGVVLQGTGQAMPLNQILTATFQLGNSSAQRRRVTILLHDGDFSDLVACTFWLTPSQALSAYSIRMFTTEAWTNATLSVYSATTGAFPWILVDSAALQTTPASTALGTECFEPIPPAPESDTSSGKVQVSLARRAFQIAR